MNRIVAFLKKLRLHQILAVVFAVMLVFTGTACSRANAQGANPDNPAVQAGGANNPYKNGGDSYTNLKQSTDPKVTQPQKSLRNQANLNLGGYLIATSKESGLLYPGAETPAGRAEKEAELPLITEKDFERPQPGGLNQRNPDLRERAQNRLEEVKDTFKDASRFTKEKADEASQRPEFKSSPARK